MKTTIDLPDELLIAAKKKAAEEKTSLRSLFMRSLQRELDQAPDFGSRPIRWVTVAGGLPPDLDVASREAMHDWIRSRSSSRPSRQ